MKKNRSFANGDAPLIYDQWSGNPLSPAHWWLFA